MSDSPVIKWTGSKRSQAAQIVSKFPKFETYYEPFVGGGSVLFKTGFQKAVAGDICKPLVDFWKLVQDHPLELIERYTEHWTRLQKEGHTYYYKVRDDFNEFPNPHDLLFLSRTCVNGLIRFNKDGKFNNSLHHTRRGIKPRSLANIIFRWSQKIKNVTFVHGDYREIITNISNRDFIYLDPPYFNTVGRYYGRIDFDEFIDVLYHLNDKGIQYALSFDGIRGNYKYLVNMPKKLYVKHFLLASGNSTFRKVMDNQVEKVKESLYLNYDPETKAGLNYFWSNTGAKNSSNF